ncbi:DUF397 domain-containing protein [Streptomyces sp. NPDC001717]|uniref:DUF397 domain-containing protein n=1 Tax=Streptomyces sp. NPDC001717 TaxID=3364604 RepID=UPI00368440A4
MSTPLAWFKSSYSGSDGGNCLEAAITWQKSSYSNGVEDACVEVATCPADQVHVRDSKVADGPNLTLTPTAWAGLTAWVSTQ